MLLRNQLLRSTSRICYNTGEGVGGAQGNQQQGNGQGNNQQGGNQGGDNKGAGAADNSNKNPLDAFKTVWQPPSKGDGGNGNGNGNGGGNNNSGGNNQGNQGNQNQGNGNNSEGGGAAFQSFLAKQNYFNGVDMASMETAFKDRDWAGFQKGFISVLQNLHGTALKNADNIASGYHDKAVDSAVGKAGAQYNTDQAYNTMFSKHPELNHQAISPVAKTMMKNALASGKSPEEAAKGIYDYFVSVGQTFYKPAGNPGDRQRGDGSGNGSGDGTANINFDDMFAGAKQ